jgi:hypothetical protein
MLNGTVGALAGAVIHETLPVPALDFFVGTDETTKSLILPKFDDHDGTRTLVGVRLETSTVIFDGRLQVANAMDFQGTLSLMTLVLTANAHVFVTQPLPVINKGDVVNPAGLGPTFTFTPQPLTKSLTDPQDGPHVDLPLGAAGSEMWEAEGDPPDYYEIVMSGQTKATLTLSAVDPGFNNFIQAPGDTTFFVVGWGHSAPAVGSPDTLPIWQINPSLQYNIVTTVVYLYTEGGEIPPYTDVDYYARTRYEFRQAPAPRFQPFYSGTAQPGATLEVSVLGVGGDVLGSTSTVVDAGGNWAASFYDLGMTGEPHTVSLRQSYAGYTPLTGAGYNLRRYFSPAMLGGAYASEQLTVENVLGKRAVDVSMAALYSASAQPIALGQTLYGYEMLPMSASPQGLH